MSYSTTMTCLCYARCFFLLLSCSVQFILNFPIGEFWLAAEHNKQQQKAKHITIHEHNVVSWAFSISFSQHHSIFLFFFSPLLHPTLEIASACVLLILLTQTSTLSVLKIPTLCTTSKEHMQAIVHKATCTEKTHTILPSLVLLLLFCLILSFTTWTMETGKLVNPLRNKETKHVSCFYIQLKWGVKYKYKQQIIMIIQYTLHHIPVLHSKQICFK